MSDALHIDSLARKIRSMGDERDLQAARGIENFVFQSAHRDNRFLANLLVETYGKCGCLAAALNVFYRIEAPNLFSWTLLMASFARNGEIRCARAIFDRMDKDLVAWNAMIQAYVENGLPDEARGLFDRMPQRNILSWTSVIAMYAIEQRLEDARSVFDRMPERNIVSWNAMIAAYAQAGHLPHAKSLLERMEEHDVVSSTTLMAAYAQHGHLAEACEIFDSMPQRDLFAWITMLQGYTQSADLASARSIFEAMPAHSPVSWTAIIVGHAQHGRAHAALEFFARMNTEGERPDEITLVGVLAACNHIGLLSRSRAQFASTRVDFGLGFRAEHYSSMVDALGRAGWLDFAEELLESMPFVPDGVAWTSLIGACRLHKDAIRAKRLAIAARARNTKNEDESSPFVLLSSAYSEGGKDPTVQHARQ